MTQRPDDTAPMRIAIEASREALAAGDAPYGATLVGHDGRVLHTARNTRRSSGDCTAHAEMVLLREAEARFGIEALRGGTLYASGEPCAMCSGALFWAGVRRVVFAAPNAAMGELLGGNLLPIPRFAARSDSSNGARVLPCRTNLLFPYVTNWAGFDTGIAIANTSDDRSPTSAGGSISSNTEAGAIQSGRCRLNYYGRLANGNAPTRLQETTDREVAAGETITMVLSSGGGLGLQGNANFQGYIIAQCDFRFAHGFAFITDGPIGQARVAEGYLALVLDGGDSSTRRDRVGSTGEARGH